MGGNIPKVMVSEIYNFMRGIFVIKVKLKKVEFKSYDSVQGIDEWIS